MKNYRGVVLPLLLILIWGIGSQYGLFNSFIVPSPLRVLSTGWNLIAKGILLKHLSVSLWRVFAGFAIAFFLAFPLAVMVGLSKKIHAYLVPSLEFIRHIPPIAMIPLLILWFGIGETSKLSVIVLATFFPIFMNTFSGIVNSNVDLEEVGVNFGFTRAEIFLKITLPQAMPSVFTGIQLGLGYSWRALMGAELIAASSGLGYMIIEAETLSRIDIIFVGVMVIGILGYAIDWFFFKIAAYFFRWEGKSNGRDTTPQFIKNI
ncbi:ABC transporter permease [Fusibacter ferrireducens]|uniref:ABC transporter permease n=1 Tax=Fusibacter ferrireducens TaxID=2785058 RepID=A0ABR9ZNQ6_9FIRM|nr:ABC transporter permease [Fusibacter ferrireducens]MBF4692098.1 ABC transporter permease [Fusibacter ferrireducens]